MAIPDARPRELGGLSHIVEKNAPWPLEIG